MSMQVSYKKQIGFFLIIFFMMLVITEITIRYIEVIEPTCMFTKSELFSNYGFLEKHKMCDEYTSLEFDNALPFAMLKPSQIGEFVNINSDGFRGGEIQFSEDTYKIFFLGGSTAFGSVTTSDETTIPGQIEKKLIERGFNVKVVNAGVSSATTIDELYILEEKILKFNPNMVIMYDGWNDVHHIDKLKFQISYSEYLKNNHYANMDSVGINFDDDIKDVNNIEKQIIEPVKTKTGIIKFFNEINYKTGLGIALYFADIIYKGNTPDLSQNISFEKLHKIEIAMEENWSKACKLGEIHEFQTVNIIQPILGTSDRIIHSDERVLLSSGEHAKYLKNLKLDEKNLPCKNIIDLRNMLENENEILYYFDLGHMTDFGYEIVANKITEKIIPLIENDLINLV